ncbi:MAG TPA: alkaline phosphatase family protein [Kofleriaceae bacterium]|nr:alkaline phosphatase family protein [Kofleriaceae bacterium]
MKQIAALLALILAGSCGSTAKVAKLVVTGDDKTVQQRPPHARPSSPHSTQILFVAFDGVSREMLYDLLHQHKLPNLAALIGGDDLEHAYLDQTLLAGMPSTTMAAWVSVLTGAPPAESGVTGNEYFIRERRELACPAPVSFVDSEPTLAIYTEGYLNKLVGVPSIYERIHQQDPEALIWVVMNHFFRGADKLILAKRQVLVRATEGFIEAQLAKASGDTSRRVYEDLDKAAIDALTTRLAGDGPMPDVLTLYVSGADLYAHIAKEGPDPARLAYLTEVIDPALGPLVEALRKRNALAHRWVIVTADHGHTQVLHDDQHAIGTSDHDAPAVLAKIGFRLRPFRQHVAENDPYSAVLAYGGPTAYVYLADRSKCPSAQDRCPFSEPPRYREDVLAAADAFYTNNEDGHLVPEMKGKLDMIFVREPRPVREVDLPFEVYIGHGKTQPIDDYLRDHPHPTYVALAERMKDLAVGTHGERAGDIMLLAHNGDRDTPEERYYFAEPYRSWHGSPSKQDSEIPLIVAHPQHSAADIKAWVVPILGEHPLQRKIADLILALRKAPPRDAPAATAHR